MAELIRIISGTFGHRVGSRITPKKPGDGPFEVDATLAVRLVKAGVAKTVKPGDVEPSSDGEGETSDAPKVVLTKTQIKEKLDAVGVTYEPKANHSTLMELLSKIETSLEDDDDTVENDGGSGTDDDGNVENDGEDAPNLGSAEVVE